MRIDSYIQQMLNNPSEHELWEKATAEDIFLTEKELGLKLPESYVQLVSEFSNGAYLYLVQEVSAVGKGNRQIAPIQAFARGQWPPVGRDIPVREGGLISGSLLVPFSLDHNGNAWCFITGTLTGEEYPVGYLDCTGLRLYGIMESFAEWLGVLIKTRQEVVRALYGDDVICGEMGLG